MTDEDDIFVEQVNTILSEVHSVVGTCGYKPETLIVAMVQVINEIVLNCDEDIRRELLEEVICAFTTQMTLLGVKKES